MAILDQRMVLLGNPGASADEVRAAWDAFRANPRWPGFPERNFDRGDYIVNRKAKPVAFVDRGRWVALCPMCNSGLAVWRDNPHGAACYDCGTIYPHVDWPTGKQQAQAETLLEERRYSRFMNWQRHLGETVTDLKAENEQHAGEVTDGVDGA